MAIVKMKRLRLAAMRRDREELLRLLQSMGCVEIDEPDADWADPAWGGLARPDGTALAQAKERRQQLGHALELLKKHAPAKDGFLRPRGGVSQAELFDDAAYEKALAAAQTLNDGERTLTALAAETSKREALRLTLAPWLTLDVPLEVSDTQQLVFQFGTLPAAVPPEQTAQAVGGLAQLMEAGSDRTARYYLLTCHVSRWDETAAALKALGWTRVTFRDLTGTALENDRRLQAEIADLTRQAQEQKAALSELGECRAALRLAADRAAVEVEREESKTHLLDTSLTFFLEGWAPSEKLPALEAALAPYACAFEVSDPAPEEYPKVPVKLKNNKLTEPLNMVTEMYSLPAYGSLDPNPLMAPFFILFYGIMMADMGYGLLMMAASLVVLRKKRPKGTMKHFFGLLGLCGITTFMMGALTGGFFGDFLPQLFKLINPSSTFALPALFTPLEDTMTILIGAMCLGFVQILTGMAISFVRKLRDGQVMDALWEEVTWWVVFASLALAVLGVTNLVLIAGGVMVLAGSGWNAKGFGKVTAVFGSLYNHVTGYFGDILSYSRLMALMLAGSVIAQVFNTLGAIPGNVAVFIIVAFVGNALNFALNLLGCYVHDLRLQCLEYFNKFYQDGGKPFRPLAFDTKYYDVVKE